MHTSAQPSRRIDELVLEALVAFQPQPVARPSDSYLEIEVAYDDEDPADVAVTHRFVRFSAPYERVEIEPLSSSLASLHRARPTTFVKTVRAVAPSPAVTLSFDKQWFEQPEDAIASIEDTSIERANSWLWLGISLVGAAIAIGLVQYAL